MNDLRRFESRPPSVMKPCTSIGVALLALAGLTACGSGDWDSGGPLGTARQAVTATGNSPRPSKVANIIEQMARSATQRARSAAPSMHMEALSNRIVHVSPAGELEVLVYARDPIGPAREAELVALGARVAARLEPGPLSSRLPVGMIQVWLPPDRVSQVASLPWAAAITPPGYPELDQAATPIVSEGVPFSRTNLAHAMGIDGAGVTVGVISDGVANLADSQARNELPGNCPGTPCIDVLSVGGGNEGTASLEIVHDMAPGADLMFSATGAGLLAHLGAFFDLAEAGSDVITEDVPFDSEPVFQGGAATFVAGLITAGGVSVYSSAGNVGLAHAPRVDAIGTGGGPEGVVFAGPPPDCTKTPDNVVAIAPGGDTPTTFDVMLPGTGIALTLQWSEPRATFPAIGEGGFTDLNLYLMDQNLTRCLAESVGMQADGEGDTIEFIGGSPPAGPAKVVVDVESVSSAVASPKLDLRLRGVALIDAPDRAGSLNPDSNYTGLASSVGEVNVFSGSLVPGSSGGPVERGLTTVCPGGPGTPGPCQGVAGPALTSTLGPTFSAPGGGSISGAGGFPPFDPACPAPLVGGQGQCLFGGTSASAPHAAGCDALIRESFPTATVADLQDRLATTAIDIEAPGPDNDSGAGVIDCFAALGFGPSSPPVAQCQDVSVDADASCMASVTPEMVDDGSFDPDGNPVTLSLGNPGPFPLGTTQVTLSVSDGPLSSTCIANVTVNDVTPPELILARDAMASLCQPVINQVVGEAMATDNCAMTPTVTGAVVDTNGMPLTPPIPVIGGEVELGIGTHTIEWTASDGVNTAHATQTATLGPTIQASESFLMGNQSTMTELGGAAAAVFNSGSGLTQVGNSAQSGSIVSVGPVDVQHFATVQGSITSATSIFVDPDATAPGPRTVGPVVLPGLPALPAFPPATDGPITVNSGTMSPPPGSYTSVNVNGGTLVLAAGDYFFQSLTINAGTTVRASLSTRIFVADTLDYRSPITLDGSILASVFLGFNGSMTLLEAPFSGTLVAPNARVDFGGSGLTFTGAFFARVLAIGLDNDLVCVPGKAPVAQPSGENCFDGIHNGSETDVDCGGPACPPCAAGQICSVDNDCSSQNCDGGTCSNESDAISAVLNFTTDWGDGYCVEIVVANEGTTPSSWIVDLNLGATTIYTSWNGNFSGNTGAISVVPAFSWNQILQPGQTDNSVGFCANRNVPGSGVLPVLVSASSP